MLLCQTTCNSIVYAEAPPWEHLGKSVGGRQVYCFEAVTDLHTGRERNHVKASFRPVRIQKLSVTCATTRRSSSWTNVAFIVVVFFTCWPRRRVHFAEKKEMLKFQNAPLDVLKEREERAAWIATLARLPPTTHPRSQLLVVWWARICKNTLPRAMSAVWICKFAATNTIPNPSSFPILVKGERY